MRTRRRTDAVAARTDVDHRPILRLRGKDVVSDKAEFIRIRVIFQARLQSRRKAVSGCESVPRSRQIDIHKPCAERPLLINLPRTEEAAFAGSPGSRWDLQRTVLWKLPLLFWNRDILLRVGCAHEDETYKEKN